MYKVIIGVFLALCSLTVKAQGETNNWYFGYNSGMHFNALTPQATSGQLYVNQGTSSMSDAAGNLLFYTDGNMVYNKQHQIMVNGFPIADYVESSQAAIIVPKPGTPDHYYIFSNTFGFDFDLNTINTFSYSEVDMTLDSGNGAVISHHNFISNSTNCRLSAVKNRNGDGYWVGIVDVDSSRFKMYSVTASGISTVPVESNTISPSLISMGGYQGCMKFSPDGTKILMTDFYLGTSLYDFDNATGVASNPRIVNTLNNSYGVEFSPSSDVAYVSTIFHNKALFQYDLTAADIPASQKTITIGNSLYELNPLGQLQLASNGKIYFSNFRSYTIGEVNDPDLLGAECNYDPHAVQMIASEPRFGLPNFVQSFFSNLITTQKYCSGSTTRFTLANPQDVVSVVWDFGDGSPTQTGLTVVHNYPAIGDYVATATITLNSGILTKQKLIKIVSQPVIANSIPDQKICGQNSMFYDLSQYNSIVLGTQLPADFGVQYFATATDAVDNINQLGITNYQLVFGTRPIYVKVFAKGNPTCFALTQFNLSLNREATAEQPSDYVICESAPYDGRDVFNLQSKTNEILNGQDPAVFNVSYHPTSNDAINNANPLPNSYTNANPTETIHARVTNVNESSCFATTTLVLKVIQSPTVVTVGDYKICDDVSNNGTETFDLITKTAEVLNGQPAATFQVTYHLNQTDAQNGVNPIAAPIVNTSQNQEIYFRISVNGNVGCSGVGSFHLVVNKLPVANTVADQYVCDNGNDGVELFDLQANNPSVLENQNVAEFGVTYHLTQSDATTNSNPLPQYYQNVSNPQTVYARIENRANPSCFASNSFKIGLNKMPVANVVPDMVACSDGASALFLLNSHETVLLGSQNAGDFNITYHLSQSDANAGLNSLNSNYTNTFNPQTIFIRLENKLARECYVTSSFQINVRQKPALDMADVYSICEGSSITVTAPLGYDSYLWSNGETANSTIITNAGNYSLTVTKNYSDIVCDQTQNFVVYNSNVAVINEIKINDWSTNQNSIEVLVTGDGDYEYSIDGVMYQSSNVFSGLSSGVYTVYVRDKKGCGIVTQELRLLAYPQFFTPNGDGYNDVWRIEFADQEPNLSLVIFDRFGKLIKKTDNANGWDGTYLGNPLPASDYWFVVKRQDGKEYKGHFALKR
ncbi:T9SS type B sorting domain-containing protein [Flavobacterium amniphilum]|uniref:T9SS type B sorting domain-containing protein n=1 Tax=Flavobacterium amniphilum TaxID=1834035 RepID=UPI00202A6CD0|nr:T9SS type B sorting domain-containing protein [Flavobacterium amniphilum]MCL9807680.1 T9SS type B sorting domain-containing protein [Flavobacterium amniphilum]